MLTRRNTLGLLAATPVALCVFPTIAMAQEPKVFQNPVAINATDPVAYFEREQPVPGSEDHKVKWNGAVWHFTSRRNASRFTADPETFAPVFGGYCAFAASRGYLAPTIPEGDLLPPDRMN